MDFKINTYSKLLKALQKQGYFFPSFSQFLQKTNGKAIILRHDVDKLPGNALRFAQIEHKLGVKGSYYFRAVPESWDENIIKEIHDLGHEIGYHYENLTTCNGNLNKAIEDFKFNLEKIRNLTPVFTICMHGSPRSKWDSKDLWKKYNYKDFSIIGEPYFDVDFEDTLYLTDTGRRWNGGSVSVRDKGLGIRKEGLGRRDPAFVKTSSGKEGLGDPYHDWRVKPKMGSLMRMTEKGTKFQTRYNFRSTNDIIRAAENGELPDKMMMTFHPQRWTNKTVPWVKELVWQNVKNVVKYYMIRIRD